MYPMEEMTDEPESANKIIAEVEEEGFKFFEEADSADLDVVLSRAMKIACQVAVITNEELGPHRLLFFTRGKK